MVDGGEGSALAARALVTLGIGCEDWLRLSEPTFKAYAARHGYELIVLREPVIRHRLQRRKARVNLHLEKFQIGPLLEGYARIVYVDADVLLTPHCPDLCELVPPHCLGVVEDPAGSLMWKRHAEMDAMQRRFGRIPEWDRRYFNAGVLVLSRLHRSLMSFDPARLLPGRWPDQTALNYHSVQWRLERQFLDPRANFLPGHEGWRDEAKRRQAWAVHYAGEEAKRFMAEDVTGNR